tara:strand:- start:12084 stop:12809 length:726 start_codon:yes stop_codon:yes gene_type:complete
MSEPVEPSVDESKPTDDELVPKSKINDIVTTRIEQNNKKWTDQVNQQGQLIETLKKQLEQSNGGNNPVQEPTPNPQENEQQQPQAPQNQQPQQMAQPQQSMTPEMVAQLMDQKAKESSAMDKINGAAKEDSEFNDLLNNGTAKAQIPSHIAVHMMSVMGDDALPAIKKALSDPAANGQLLHLDSQGDYGSIVNWAHKVGAESAAANKSKQYKSAPDIMGAGNTAAPSDDDDMKSIVANTII